MLGVGSILAQSIRDAWQVGIEVVGERKMAFGVHVLVLRVEHDGQVMVSLGQLRLGAKRGAQERFSAQIVP